MKRGWPIILGLIFVFSVTLSIASELSADFSVKTCNQGCKENLLDEKEICNLNYKNCTSSVRMNCFKEKVQCLKNVTNDYRTCREDCKTQSAQPCKNGSVEKGDIYEFGCEKCECKARGKVSCKLDAFCNKNTTITKSVCEVAGGLFQQICNGPYFDIVCSQQNFCLCEGDLNYTCPSTYQCLKNFISPNTRLHTTKGWKSMLGAPLGDVGVCVQNSGAGEESEDL